MSIKDDINIKLVKPSKEEVIEFLKHSNEYDHLIEEYSRELSEKLELAIKEQLKEE